MSTNRQIFETFMTTLIIGAGMKTMQPTRPNNLQDSDKSKDNALNDITDFEEVSSQPLPVEEVVNESKA